MIMSLLTFARVSRTFVLTVYSPRVSSDEQNADPTAAAARTAEKATPGRRAPKAQPAAQRADRTARPVGHAREQRLAARVRSAGEIPAAPPTPPRRGMRRRSPRAGAARSARARAHRPASRAEESAPRRSQSSRRGSWRARSAGRAGGGKRTRRSPPPRRGSKAARWCSAVARALEVQREEGVERAVRGRHAEAAGEKPHRRAIKSPRHRPGMDARAAARQREGSRERGKREAEHRPGQGRHRRDVEPCAAGKHRCDEADRAPKPDRAVAPGLPASARERDRFDQRQRARGNETLKFQWQS